MLSGVGDALVQLGDFRFRFQLFENFCLRANRRCNVLSLGKNFLSGDNRSTGRPSDGVMNWATPQSIPTTAVDACRGGSTCRNVLTLTCHCPADWLTVTLRISPRTSRLLR